MKTHLTVRAAYFGLTGIDSDAYEDEDGLWPSDHKACDWTPVNHYERHQSTFIMDVRSILWEGGPLIRLASTSFTSRHVRTPTCPECLVILDMILEGHVDPNKKE